jgi:hypothetical protein
MESNSGKASATPAPRKTARREICFFVITIAFPYSSSTIQIVELSVAPPLDPKEPGVCPNGCRHHAEGLKNISGRR